MPSNLVKTPQDKKLWNKAKEAAADQGHTEDWGYVTAIFMKMKGETNEQHILRRTKMKEARKYHKLYEAKDIQVKVVDGDTKKEMWRGSLNQFIKDNEDVSSPVLLPTEIEDLKNGKAVNFGGGAAPWIVVQKIEEAHVKKVADGKIFYISIECSIPEEYQKIYTDLSDDYNQLNFKWNPAFNEAGSSVDVSVQAPSWDDAMAEVFSYLRDIGIETDNSIEVIERKKPLEESKKLTEKENWRSSPRKPENSGEVIVIAGDVYKSFVTIYSYSDQEADNVVALVKKRMPDFVKMHPRWKDVDGVGMILEFEYTEGRHTDQDILDSVLKVLDESDINLLWEAKQEEGNMIMDNVNTEEKKTSNQIIVERRKASTERMNEARKESLNEEDDHHEEKELDLPEWLETAMNELAEHEGLNKWSVFQRGESPFGHGIEVYSDDGEGQSGESEWMIFETWEDAERAALERVTEDLENEPEIFTQSWLQNYMTIYPTDKRMIAIEEADNAVDDRDLDELRELYEDEIGEEPDNDKDENDLIDDITSHMSDRIEKELDDPIEYFVEEHDMYTLEDLFKASFIRIDIEKAAQDAIVTDGVAHFLDHYDGEETELNSGAYAFGTN